MKLTRQPTAAEVGKAHKTITLATRPAKPDEVGLPTSILREQWRSRADQVVDVDRVLDRVLAGARPQNRVGTVDGQARTMPCCVVRSASIESSGMSARSADARTMATAAYSA